MQDTRWDDPGKTPVSNGPLRAVTAPVEFKFRFIDDGQYIEFLLRYPMHIVDPNHWKALECIIEGRKALIERPLTEEVWLALSQELNAGEEPPVSEALFCDALLSATAGDEIKAVLELGVAAEVELSDLLDTVSQLVPDNPDKTDYRNKKR